MSGISIDNGGLVRVNDSQVGPDVRAGDGITVVTSTAIAIASINHEYSNEWHVQQVVKNNDVLESAITGWNLAVHGVGSAGVAEFGVNAIGLWGLSSAGSAVRGTVTTSNDSPTASGVALRGEIINTELGNSTVSQLVKSLSVNTVPTVNTTISVDTYLPAVTGMKASAQAATWKVGYDSLSSPVTSKAILGLLQGGAITDTFTFARASLTQPASSTHMFGAIGLRSDGASMQFKDDHTGTDWMDIYHTHITTSTAFPVDTVVPTTPTSLRYAWRNEGDLNVSWLNPAPTTNGNKLIHDYELEASYNTDFTELFYHQHVGHQTETIIGVKSLAPSFDLRLPDGVLENAIELLYSGTAVGGSTNSLLCTASPTLEALGVAEGMVCRYQDLSGHWSCGTIASVSANLIVVDGLWSNIYGDGNLFPRENCAFTISRTMLESQFRDYSDPTSDKYGYFGANESPFTTFESSVCILNGALVAEGDVLGSGHTGVATLRYPMQDPNYAVEAEMEMKNPFNGGHLAVALRCSAYNLNVDASIYKPTYYACVVDFGWGGTLSKNGVWIEKQTYPQVSEVGMFGTVFPASTTLDGGIAAVDTSITVTDGDIFSKSVSLPVTASSFTATTFSVPAATVVSAITRGFVVAYGTWKAVVESVGDVVGSYRIINVFQWFCSAAGGGAIPTSSGAATIVYNQYAIIRNQTSVPYYVEAVKITDISTNVLTVERAQFGSIALPFQTGNVIGPRFTPEYNRKYRLLANISNAVEGTPPTLINFYVDGTLYASASDACTGTAATTNNPEFTTGSPYNLITIPSGEGAVLSDLVPGDVVYTNYLDSARVAHFTYNGSTENIIYVTQWVNSAGVGITNPAAGCTLSCKKEKFTRAGQLAVGGISWGIHVTGETRYDLYTYRLNSRYTSYRMSDVYVRVRAHNQIGKSPWAAYATVHAPDRMCPQLTALDIIPDHHVVAWTFDALAPEVSGYELKAYTADVGGSWVYTRPVSGAERILVVPMDATYDALWWQIGTIDPFGLSDFSPYRVKTEPTRSTTGVELWVSNDDGGVEATYLANGSMEPVVVGGFVPGYMDMGVEGSLSTSAISQLTSYTTTNNKIAVMGVTTGDITAAGVLGYSTGAASALLGINTAGGYGGGFVTRYANDATVLSAGGIRRQALNGTPVAETGVGFDYLLENAAYPDAPVVAAKTAAVWDGSLTHSRYSMYAYDTASLFRTADFMVQSSSGTDFSSQLKLLSKGTGLYGYGFITSETTAGAMMPLLMASSGLYIGNSLTATTGSLLGFTVAQGKIINITTPATIAGSYTLTLPTTDGTSGYVLSTDGAGVLDWVENAAGTSPWHTASNICHLITETDTVRVGALIPYALTGITNKLNVDGTLGIVTNSVTKPGITFGFTTSPWVSMTNYSTSNYGFLSVYTRGDASAGTVYPRANIGPYDAADNSTIKLFSGTTADKTYSAIESLLAGSTTKRDLLLIGSSVRINNIGISATLGWDCGSGLTNAALVVQNGVGGGHTSYGSSIACTTSMNYTAAIVGKTSSLGSYAFLGIDTSGGNGVGGCFITYVVSVLNNTIKYPLIIKHQNSDPAGSLALHGSGVGMLYYNERPDGNTNTIPIASTYTAYSVVDPATTLWYSAFGISTLRAGVTPYLTAFFDFVPSAGSRLQLNAVSNTYTTIRSSNGGFHTDGTTYPLYLEASYVDITSDSASATALYIEGKRILKVQQAHIANAGSGTEITTINAILAMLEAHGLVATS
jgi:hypothetical protein